jgi:hypothetical protein
MYCHIQSYDSKVLCESARSLGWQQQVEMNQEL